MEMYLIMTIVFPFFLLITDYTFFVAFVILLSLTHAAPSMQRHQRHIYDPYTSPNVYHTKMEWVNPCGGEYMATSYESTSADSSMSLRTRNVSIFVMKSNTLFAISQPAESVRTDE